MGHINGDARNCSKRDPFPNRPLYLQEIFYVDLECSLRSLQNTRVNELGRKVAKPLAYHIVHYILTYLAFTGGTSNPNPPHLRLHKHLDLTLPRRWVEVPAS